MNRHSKWLRGVADTSCDVDKYAEPDGNLVFITTATAREAADALDALEDALLLALKRIDRINEFCGMLIEPGDQRIQSDATFADKILGYMDNADAVKEERAARAALEKLK